MSKLNTVTSQANSGIVIDDVLDHIYESFRPIIPYDRMGFALLEDDGQMLRSRWSRSETTKVKLVPGYSAAMVGSSLMEILRTGKPRILNDLQEYLQKNPNSDSTKKILAEGIRSSLTCPLIAMGKPIGFLFFSSSKPNTYENIHVDLFLQIAAQLSAIIEKSRLYEQVEQTNRRLLAEIEERKKVEAALRESQERLQNANRTLQQLANLDGLTGVANRRVFAERLRHEWLRAIRNQEELSLLLVDVDYFKSFNDTYGHLAGDDCLKQVAAAAKACVHRPADLVARYGGEEFVLLLPQTNAEGAAQLAESLCQKIRDLRITHESSKVADHVTVSVGTITHQPRPRCALDQFIYAADAALYRAKANGRNQFQVGSMQPSRRAKMAVYRSTRPPINKPTPSENTTPTGPFNTCDI